MVVQGCGSSGLDSGWVHHFEEQRPREFEGLNLVELDMVPSRDGFFCLSGGSLRWSS